MMTITPAMTVSIDWLDFTVLDNGFGLKEIFEFLGFDSSFFSDTEHGARGYKSMHKLGDYAVIVLSDGREDMGIHVSIGGSAINHVLTHYAQAKHYAPTPFGDDLAADWDFRPVLVQFLDDIQNMGHITRMDICADDYNARFTPAELWQYNNEGRIVSKFRSFTLIQSSKSKGKSTGATFSAGSRGAGVFLRVYDKALEQIAKDKPCEYDKWIRWEFELRDERACKVADCLIQGSELGTVFYGLLNNYVRITLLDDENVTRRSYLPEWFEFTQAVKPLRLYCPPCEKVYDDKKNWIESQVLPTLAGIIMVDGYEWIHQHWDEAEARIHKSYKAILNSELDRRNALERNKSTIYIYPSGTSPMDVWGDKLKNRTPLARNVAR